MSLTIKDVYTYVPKDWLDVAKYILIELETSEKASPRKFQVLVKPAWAPEAYVDDAGIFTDTHPDTVVVYLNGKVTWVGHDITRGNRVIDGVVDLTVVDEEDVAVEGAEVTLTCTDPEYIGVDETDASGNVVFEELISGTYTYSIVKDDFVTGTGTIQLNAGTVTKEVILLAETWAVTFVVVDGATKIEGAVVTVDEGEWNEVESDPTDADGETVVYLTEGTHAYTVVADDYEDYTSTTTVAEAAKTVNVDMLEYSNVTFTVLGTDSGQPVVGATINMALGGAPLFTDVTDAAGQVTFTNVTPNTYNVSATKADTHLTYSGTIVVANDDINDATFNMDEVWAVNFHVDNGAAINIENATVTLGVAGSLLTGPDGYTTGGDFAGAWMLPSGNYTYTVVAENYVTQTDVPLVVAGANITIEVDMVAA